MTCPHNNFRVVSNVSKVIREEDAPLGVEAPVEMFVAEFAMFCGDCRMPFKFNWTVPADPAVIPLGTQIMSTRPWVSFMNETFGVTISPMENGGRYIGQTDQVGHA